MAATGALKGYLKRECGVDSDGITVNFSAIESSSETIDATATAEFVRDPKAFFKENRIFMSENEKVRYGVAAANLIVLRTLDGKKKAEWKTKIGKKRDGYSKKKMKLVPFHKEN